MALVQPLLEAVALLVDVEGAHGVNFTARVGGNVAYVEVVEASARDFETDQTKIFVDWNS